MAVSTAQVIRESIGAEYLTVTDVTPDASFAAGGEALAKTLIGCPNVCHAAFVEVPAGLVGRYDRTTEELFVYESGTADAALNEVDTEDLSAIVIRITAFGQ